MCAGVLGTRVRAETIIELARDKFKNGTMWKVNNIYFGKKDKKYLACSHNVLIDMNASNFQPVLQSTVKMPGQATPYESLDTLLQCSPGQLVDVIAFVTHVSEKRQVQTFLGMRDVCLSTSYSLYGKKKGGEAEARWTSRSRFCQI